MNTNSKRVKLTDNMDGFKDKKVDYAKYETSFRRWIVSQIDGNHMSIQDIRDRFGLCRRHYTDVLKRWQSRYSEELHLSLSFMTSKERSDNQKLENRIKELEKQLDLAKMKNIALDTMIDVAESELKISIRKKSGSKQ